MYEEYWGLKEKPFENTPDPRFLYRSPQHEEGLMRLVNTSVLFVGRLAVPNREAMSMRSSM